MSAWLFARGLIETLRKRELDATVARLGVETGLTHAPSGVGDYVTGIYRQRVTLASGRFAMIDDGLGFPTRTLAPGAGAETRPARVRHHAAGWGRGLEFWPAEGTGALRSALLR